MIWKLRTDPHHISTALLGQSLINVFLFQTSDSSKLIEEVELSVFGLVGLLASSVALAGIWMKYRPCLLPLIIFLLFTIIFDCISVFSSLTAGAEDPGDLTTASTYIPLFSSRQTLVVVVFKVLFSLFMTERLVYNYRRNIMIRGGRSPVKRNTKNNVENSTAETHETNSKKEDKRFYDVELGKSSL